MSGDSEISFYFFFYYIPLIPLILRILRIRLLKYSILFFFFSGVTQLNVNPKITWKNNEFLQKT